MNDLMYWGFCILSGLILSLVVEFFFSDHGFCDKKRIARRVDSILYAKRLYQIDKVTFTYKGVEFTVYAKQPDTDNPYKILELFINCERVIVVHVLEDLMYNHRVVKFNSSRNEKEVRKILKLASKEAEKRQLSAFMQEKATHKSYFE